MKGDNINGRLWHVLQEPNYGKEYTRDIRVVNRGTENYYSTAGCTSIFSPALCFLKD